MNKSQVLYLHFKNGYALIFSFQGIPIGSGRKCSKFLKSSSSMQLCSSFIRSSENSIFNIFDPAGLKILTSLRLSFFDLNKHRFQHNFQECLNPLCTCSLEIENTSHYLLPCNHKTPFRTDLTNSVKTFVVEFVSLLDRNSFIQRLSMMVIKIILYYQLL